MAVSRWLHALRARLRLLARRSAESRIDHELQFHVDMEAEQLERDGVEPAEARRRALARFGGVQQHRETLRAGRGTAWLGGLSLDFTLGARMLVKYPGLTIVGGLAMAFGIWFGAVTFALAGVLVRPTLPLPGGDRIVQVRVRDLKEGKTEQRILSDYLAWQGAVRSLTDLGAYRNVDANLVGADGVAHPVVAAAVTASAFRIAPDRPLLGRVLEPADERPGAAPVVVLGHGVWQQRFAGDAGIIGRSVQVGAAHAAVVGVMPAGFAFPVAHEMWLPLQVEAAPAPRTGPGVYVFGRLAPGVSFASAQAELASLGARAAAASPATHAQLEPQVGPYADAFFDSSDDQVLFALIEAFAVALLAVLCGNVSLLLFARAASRETEIVVRSALGASRGRIVAQLFAEALVLGGMAAAFGLAAAYVTLERWGRAYLELNMGRLPFWYDVHLSAATVGYAALLTLLGAAIAGIIPARRITRGLGTQLKAGAAGGGGARFSGFWTAVIIAQVALTVALPSVVLLELNEMRRVHAYDPGFDAARYLGIDVRMADSEGANADTALARFGASLEALRHRVEAEPGVAGVTFTDHLPRQYHPQDLVEVSDEGNALHVVSIAAVDPSYFSVLDAPLRAGRAFSAADVANGGVVIVDQGFVEEVMQGRNPVGRRVWFSEGRTADPNAPDRRWHEIIGVAKDLGMADAAQSQRPVGIYLPSAPGRADAVQLVVRGRGDPRSLGARVRALATGVDPTMKIVDMQNLERVTDGTLWFLGLWLRITIGLTAITLVLSLAGIYAVLAFTVARRTREIGVRVALGASARRVIAAIFRRPLLQVLGGVAAGSLLIAAAATALPHTTQFRDVAGMGLSAGDVGLLAVYAAVMFGICLLACVVPTWRALRVQPTEALRAE